jgi:hypothetical protein
MGDGRGLATLASSERGVRTVASGRYEIRVKGRLTASLQTAFEGMTAQVEPVETILTGNLEDQAALYGVLEHVRALGLELVEVRRVAAIDSVPPESTRGALQE